MHAGVSTPRPGSPFRRAEFLGVRLDLLTLPQLLDAVQQAIVGRQRLTIMYLNAHCMNIAAVDRSYREIVNRAGIVYCDGTGVKVGARALRIRVPQRMTGADWIHDLARLAAGESFSLFLLGGEPGSAEQAAARLVSQQPNLRVVGTASGFDLGSHTLAQIQDARPDILLVGMGTPTQERWIDLNRGQLDVPVVWAVGALFDFVSGRIPRGPSWMTDHGLEWLCRLAVEPGKLWRRYVFGNPRFLFRVARAWWDLMRP